MRVTSNTGKTKTDQSPAFKKEFWLFAALLLLSGLIVFHRPILRGEILGNLDYLLIDVPFSSIAPSEVLEKYKQAPPWTEDFLNQFYVWTRFARQTLAEKSFPAWIPYPSAGSPFVGRQQTAIFNPLKIPFYLFGSDHLFLLWVLLRFCLAGIFVYLFCRHHQIGSWGSAFSALVYPCTGYFTDWLQNPHADAAAILPALFLLVDLFLDGPRQRALALLPLAVALSTVMGHAETSLHSFFATALYLLWRIARGISRRPGEQLALIFQFGAAAALGALVAAAHLLPSYEYFSLSYTRLWRGGKHFSWEILENISRPLAWEDAFQLGVAGIGVFLAVYSLRRFWKQDILKQTWKSSVWLLLLAIAGVSACAAGIMNVGFENLPALLVFPHGYQIPFPFGGYAGVAPLFLALLGFLSKGCPPPLRGLGWIYLFFFLLAHKTPLLGHAVSHIPYLGMAFYKMGTVVMPFAAAVLAGKGLEDISKIGQESAGMRMTYLSRFLFCLLSFAIGLPLGAHFSSLLADRSLLGSSPDFSLSASAPLLGGITDPGNRNVTQSTYTVRGWLRSSEVRQVQVGVANDSGKVSLWPARLRQDMGTAYFQGDVSLEKGQRVMAAVDYFSRNRAWIKGPKIRYLPQAGSQTSQWLLLVSSLLTIAAALALPLPKLWTVGILLSVAALDLIPHAMTHYTSTRSDLIFPKNAPALKPILGDRDLFRIDAPGDENILRPESFLGYGLFDFRNRDTLDVMAFKHFAWFLQRLEQSGAKGMEQAALLRGLVNVKYLIERMDRPPRPREHYEMIYEGEVRVYRNKSWLPRALFFTQALSLPLKDLALENLRDGQQVADRVYSLIHQGLLAPDQNLLIHAPFLAPERTGPALAPENMSRAEILSYRSNRVVVRVEAPSPGWLFLSDTYFPGWQAYVDGTRTEIRRAWMAFRAVHVPSPGKHDIIFIYRPLPFRIGAGVSLVAGFIFLGLWYRARRHPYLSPVAEPHAYAETVLVVMSALPLAFWGIWGIWSYL